jgi:hypothetical protein
MAKCFVLYSPEPAKGWLLYGVAVGAGLGVGGTAVGIGVGVHVGLTVGAQVGVGMGVGVQVGGKVGVASTVVGDASGVLVGGRDKATRALAGILGPSVLPHRVRANSMMNANAAQMGTTYLTKGRQIQAIPASGRIATCISDTL